MDKFIVPVEKGGETLEFEVLDFAHDDDHQCKFELHLNERFVASFEPDQQGFLHVCKNPGKIDEGTLHEIAEKIENYHF